MYTSSNSPLNGASYIWLHFLNFVVWINIDTSCGNGQKLTTLKILKIIFQIRSGIKINHPLLPDVGVLQKTADANMMFISNIPAVGNIAHACGVHQKSNGQMLYPV